MIGLELTLKATPLVTLLYVSPLIINEYGPIPTLAVKVNCPVPPLQIVFPDKFPWGEGFTVIVNVVAVPAQLTPLLV